MSTFTSGAIIWSIPQCTNPAQFLVIMMSGLTVPSQKQFFWQRQNSYASLFLGKNGLEIQLAACKCFKYMSTAFRLNIQTQTQARRKMYSVALGSDGLTASCLRFARPRVRAQSHIFSQTAWIYNSVEKSRLHFIAYSVRNWSISLSNNVFFGRFGPISIVSVILRLR